MKNYFTERKEKDISMYTDLALERRRADTETKGVEYTSKECNAGIWECVRIHSDEGEKSIGRPRGRYSTLSTGRMDLLSEEEIGDVTEEIARKLCESVDILSVVPDRILVLGLGNRELTPDSIGPKTAQNVKPTLHIKEFDEEMFDALECSEIAILTPGVMSESGLESQDIIRGVSKKILPDLVIAVDSITTRSADRLGSTVQISDTGIFPGSGVGNSRRAINEDSVGCPVISVGVPTVIDSRVFAGEACVGDRGARDGMLVCPKEIGEITNIAARIIGDAINQAFGISAYC